MTETISAAAFKEMILCADAAVHANMQAINELNVFPVPDGDTGTNMSLTLGTAVAELKKQDFTSIGDAAAVTSKGLLRGARGNSGVILSLLFRGISKKLKGMETAGPAEFANALQAGVEAAYEAVMKPAEGTVLTVSRLASAAAVSCAEKGGSMQDVLEAAIADGEAALADTMNLNPVLKKAGVIDAGGKGYMMILHSMYESLKGTFVWPTESGTATVIEEEDPFAKFTDEDITFAFDTVYIVRKNDPDVNLRPLREYLSSIGDCLVIGEDDETFKVHVHTDTPGDALTESQKYGTLELAKIENMVTQHNDILAGRKAQTTDDLEKIEEELEARIGQEDTGDVEEAAPEKEYGIVTVCAGAGVESVFRELGADQIVTGGQTMNPSTDDILRAVKKTPASTVFVFPNNKNIIMAAEQCSSLTEKKVIVMPTKTIPQGVSAMLNFSPDVAEAELIETMNGAAANVHTAMLTYAARDSEFDGYSIKEGEYLALLDGALAGSNADLNTIIGALCEKTAEMSPEFITLYYGADVSEDTAEEIGNLIQKNLPDAEVSVVNGGQPVYYYMIAIE